MVFEVKIIYVALVRFIVDRAARLCPVPRVK